MRELNWVYYYSNVEKDQNQLLITKLIANTVFKLNCTHN